VKEIFDAFMVTAFVLFMVWLVVGYHHQRGHHKRGEEDGER